MRAWLGIGILILLSACASHPVTQSDDDLVQRQGALENYNRTVFDFNMTLDRWFLKPVAKGYDVIVPKPLKTGVGNFFDNITEVRNVFNDVLQWKWKRAGLDTSRFVVNSTLGVLGVFDIAGRMGIEKNEGEDFGQTLAVWGVPQGPYIVLPVLGPSSARGIGGKLGDWYVSPLISVESQTASWGLIGLNTVNNRADLLQVEELVSGDFYLFVKDAYLQRREYLIKDGKLEDSFGDDFDSGSDWGDLEAENSDAPF